MNGAWLKQVLADAKAAKREWPEWAKDRPSGQTKAIPRSGKVKHCCICDKKFGREDMRCDFIEAENGQPICIDCAMSALE